MRTLKFPIVYVEWVDSCSSPVSWMPITEVSNHLEKIATVGFLVAESKECITLVRQHGLEDTSAVGGDITIPKAVITKRKVLKK